jgi:hypothetical protein
MIIIMEMINMIIQGMINNERRKERRERWNIL